MSKQIAITQRVQVVEQTGERRDALSQEWAVFAQACGFCPVILPTHGEADPEPDPCGRNFADRRQ